MSNEITNKQPMTLEQYAEDTLVAVQEKVTKRGLTLPKNYQVNNGLSAAILAVQQAVDKNGKPSLSVCTPESVKQFLLNVVTNGLYLQKGHGYAVVFDNKLTLLTSYMGEAWKAKQSDSNIKDIFAECVYEHDEFRYSIKHGHKVITVHEQDWKNIDPTKLVGAYATILYHDGTEVSEFMPMDQIRKSWNMGQAKGQSKAHVLAPAEMAKKTVIRKLSKMVNATNDSFFMEEQVEEAMNEIDSKQNRGYIDIGGDDSIVSDVDDPSDDWTVVDDTSGDDEPKTVDDLEQVALPFDLA